MATPEIVTGYDNAIAVQLTRNGANIAIDSGATVRAALVSVGRNESYTDPIEQSDSTPGAAWATGLVVLKFGPEDTAGIGFQGRALMEVQVVDGDSKPWFLPVNIVTGRIPLHQPDPEPEP
jgi:hypothetical protein